MELVVLNAVAIGCSENQSSENLFLDPTKSYFSKVSVGSASVSAELTSLPPCIKL